MSAKIKRNIHFYKISSTVPDEDGHAEPVDIVQVSSLLSEICGDIESNFLDVNDDEKIGLWIDRKSFPLRLKFGKIRHKGFPQKNNGLTLEGLELDGDGLVELTHVVIWDNGFVGVEYNFYGPRTSSISKYIFKKVQERVYFHKIVNQDVDAAFREIGDVLSVKMRFYSSMLHTLSNEKSGLISALDTISKETPSDVIEIGVKNYKEDGSPKHVSRKAVNFLKKLVKGEKLPVLAGARIEGEGSDGRKVERNLLDDLFVFTTEVIKMDKFKAVESKDMYSKLEQTYTREENVLLDASQLVYYNDDE